MPKTCTSPGCTRKVWGKGFCDWHQWMRPDKKLKQIKQVELKPKKQIQIRPRTKKRAAQYAIYAVLRAEFFSKPENQMCRVFPWLPACDVHHMKGKIGDLLNDVRWWLPVSRSGHDWCENNPEAAKVLNFSKDRLTIEET
jgi:hypothetical protein